MGGHLRALGLLQLQLGLEARSLALVRVSLLAHCAQPKHKTIVGATKRLLRGGAVFRVRIRTD